MEGDAEEGGGGEGQGASSGLGRGRTASPGPPRGGARRRVAACPALRRPARASLFPPSGQRGANEEVLSGSVAARAAPCPLLPARGGAGVPGSADPAAGATAGAPERPAQTAEGPPFLRGAVAAPQATDRVPSPWKQPPRGPGS